MSFFRGHVLDRHKKMAAKLTYTWCLQLEEILSLLLLPLLTNA